MRNEITQPARSLLLTMRIVAWRDGFLGHGHWHGLGHGLSLINFTPPHQ